MADEEVVDAGVDDAAVGAAVEEPAVEEPAVEEPTAAPPGRRRRRQNRPYMPARKPGQVRGTETRSNGAWRGIQIIVRRAQRVSLWSLGHWRGGEKRLLQWLQNYMDLRVFAVKLQL